MTTATILFLVVVVVAIVLIAAVVAALAARRRREHEVRRERAGELRGDAAVDAAGVVQQERRADDLEREARQLREKADMLEERAATQRRTAQMAAAEQEDTLRSADRLDPDVDHRSDDYAPDLDAPRQHSEAAAAADHEVTHDSSQPRPTDPDDPDFRTTQR